MLCWINGTAVDQLSVQDRGLAYGDGLFETILIHKGKAHLLDQHIQRMERGLKALLFSDQVIEALRKDLERLTLPENAVLKIVITRGTGQRGYAFPKEESVSRILMLSPTSDTSDKQQNGIIARFCRHVLPVQPALAGIKHLNRLDQVLARAEWDDQTISEGIVCDIDSYIVEGTMSNLFWITDGKLYTPTIDRCGVQGVMRDHLIQLAAKMGLQLESGHFYKQALLGADEIFMCNSVIGIWPVIKIDAQSFEIGAMTRELQHMLHKELNC